MAQFRKSRSKGPFRVTATKSGLSFSVGSGPLRYSVNTKGEARRTLRVPGTGVYSTKKIHDKKPTVSKPARVAPSTAASAPPVRPAVTAPSEPSEPNVSNVRKDSPTPESMDAVTAAACGFAFGVMLVLAFVWWGWWGLLAGPILGGAAAFISVILVAMITGVKEAADGDTAGSDGAHPETAGEYGTDDVKEEEDG